MRSTSSCRSLKLRVARIKFVVLMNLENPAEVQTRAPPDASPSTSQSAACDVPEGQITPEALLERAKLMFLDESASPKASGLGGVANAATLRLICLADQARSTLWASSEAHVRHCCEPRVRDGLIDKQELLGYLLADLLDRPVLPAEDARPVGQRGENGLIKAKRELKVKTNEAVWRHAGTSKPAPAIAKVIASPYDVKLPPATAGGKRPASFWLERDEAAAAASKKAAYSRSQTASLAFKAAQSRRDATTDAYVAALNGDAPKPVQTRLECAYEAAEADFREAGGISIGALETVIEAERAHGAATLAVVAHRHDNRIEELRIEEAQALANLEEAEACQADCSEEPPFEWDQLSEYEIRADVRPLP